ncbi:MAG TPA: ABC transporter, partial [Clostridiales bacterium]|nr:ABC transporter [Clostridiales bacterium]
GEQIGASIQSWSYEEICSHSFKLVMPSEYYRYDPAASAYTDMSETEAGMDYLFNSDDVGMTLKVVGIVRQNQDAVSGMMQGVIGYTSALTAHIIDAAAGEEIILRQAGNP